MKVQRSLQPREGFGGPGGSKLISPNGRVADLIELPLLAGPALEPVGKVMLVLPPELECEPLCDGGSSLCENEND